MTGSSIGGIINGLGVSLSSLESAGTSLDAARELAGDFLEACQQLGVESTEARAEQLLQELESLAGQLEQAGSQIQEIIAQAQILGRHGISGGVKGSTGGVGGDPSSLTTPSRAPDPMASADGESELVSPRDTPAMQESIRIQNRSAEVIAAAGYRIRRLPRFDDRKSPDYEIEGKSFDCYAPASQTKPDAIRTKLRQKLKDGQADRFVVNLDRSHVSVEELRQHLARTAPGGLQEVLVVKQESVIRVWP